MSTRLYVCIRRAWTRHANTLMTRGLVGGPPLMPAILMGHALEHRLSTLLTGIAPRVTGTAMVVHERHLQGQVDDRRTLQFYQRRGVSFVAGRKPRGPDYPGQQGVALSLQAVAEAHWCVSLIYEVDARALRPERLRDAADRALHGGRLAGGRLEIEPGGLSVHELLEAAIAHVGHGWVVDDASAELLGVEGDPAWQGHDRAEQLIAAVLAPKLANTPGPLRAAAVMGYAALERPTSADARQGVREGASLHAFVEPLIGVVTYRPLRRDPNRAAPGLWHWIADTEEGAAATAPAGIFYLTQHSDLSAPTTAAATTHTEGA